MKQEPTLVSLPHDPNCVWCAANVPPDLSQLEYGRLRLIPRLPGAAGPTTTVSSPEDSSTSEATRATSGICLKTSDPARANGAWPTLESTCQPSSSTEGAGPSQREQPASTTPWTRIPSASTSRSGSTPSNVRDAVRAAARGGHIAGGEE